LSKNDDWVPVVGGAIGGGILGIFIDEIFTVGPRINNARQVGFNEGWWQKDAQLQPVISDLKGQIAELRNITLNQEHAIGRIEGVVATLFVFTQELLKLVSTDKVDKEQLEELIQTKIIDTLKQLSAQVNEAKSQRLNIYQGEDRLAHIV